MLPENGERRRPGADLPKRSDMAHVPHMVERRRIEQYSQAIVREFQPEKIILFGSYAYGTPTEDSDVDLLVVMSHAGKNSRQAAEIETRLPPGFALDLLVRAPAEIQHRAHCGDCFIQEITTKGRVLHARTDR